MYSILEESDEECNLMEEEEMEGFGNSKTILISSVRVSKGIKGQKKGEKEN
jgi:hypothetical protein